jgi:hypothetical protein
MNGNDTEKPSATNHAPYAAPGSGPQPDTAEPKGSKEAGRALLAGLLGGVASAVGYVIYSRLDPDQKEKLHGTVRNVVESRISEIRSNFDL